MKREALEDEIRQVVLSSVEVDGLTAADLAADEPLFGDGIGLDSIDALEIGAALRKKYQVKFERVPLKNVAKNTRCVPDAYIAKTGNDVTKAFIDYAAPIVGPLPKIGRFKGVKVKK